MTWFSADQIKNAKSTLGADIQWFFDFLDPKYKKVGDKAWQTRYETFIVLNGDLINGAKHMNDMRKDYSGPFIYRNLSDLNDTEIRRLLLQNSKRMRNFTKAFYDTMNEILNSWFTNVLLAQAPKERLDGSSLQNREKAEIQFYNALCRYYSFIIEHKEQFVFTDDGAAPFSEEITERYSGLVNKMNHATKIFRKYVERA